MKKSFLLITLFLLLGGAIIFFYYKDYSQTHRSMSNRVNTASSRDSEITFNGNKGDQITINYSSNVKSGNLNFSLTNKEGTVIETFDSGMTSSKKVILDKKDQYSLWASYDNFIGKYHISVNK